MGGMRFGTESAKWAWGEESVDLVDLTLRCGSSMMDLAVGRDEAVHGVCMNGLDGGI